MVGTLAPPSFHLYELKIYPEPADEAFLATFSDLASTDKSDHLSDSAFIADTKPKNNYTLLHQRLTHPSDRVMHHMIKSDNWINLPTVTSKDIRLHEEHHCTG